MRAWQRARPGRRRSPCSLERRPAGCASCLRQMRQEGSPVSHTNLEKGPDMRARRRVVTVLLSLAMVAVSVGAAEAAPPQHAKQSGATVLGAIHTIDGCIHTEVSLFGNTSEVA